MFPKMQNQSRWVFSQLGISSQSQEDKIQLRSLWSSWKRWTSRTTSLSQRRFQKEKQTRGEGRRTRESNNWETIRGKPVQSPEQLLQSGSYVSLSGKRNTRILHRLGACFWVPGIEYPRFRYAGTVMPPSSDFHQGCSGCAKAGTVDQALHHMKSERKVRGEGRSRPPKTSGVRACTRARVWKRLVSRCVPFVEVFS